MPDDLRKLLDRRPEPVWCRLEPVPAGLTSDAAWTVFRRDQNVAFLDSRPGYSDSQWSIIALEPYLTLRAYPDRCEINGQIVEGDAWQLLEQILSSNRLEPLPALPLHGGCIGFVSYDAGFWPNSLPLPPRAAAKAAEGYPLMSFVFYDCMILFNHQDATVFLRVCGQNRPVDESLGWLRARLLEPPAEPVSAGSAQARIDFPTEHEWVQKVEELREQIRLGEVYIANLTSQFNAESDIAGDELYDRLRRFNPAPMAAFIRQGPLEIISSSPERLLRIDAAGYVETRPIKGTRPRGNNPRQDSDNAAELLDSGKDRSELLMITDLERNDLSRVCTADSVIVRDLFRLETYPAVFHLTATVTGRLKPGISPVECLRVCFPGGSITGAPKAAAMKIIDHLESQPRSLYTGSLGYFSLDGRADHNILIRTAVKLGRQISYGAGGGITWESDPVAEYQEMLLKAAAFERMLTKGGND